MTREDKMATDISHHFRPVLPREKPIEVTDRWLIGPSLPWSRESVTYGPRKVADLSGAERVNLVFMVVGLGFSYHMTAHIFGTSTPEVERALLSRAGSDLARILRANGAAWLPPWSGKFERF